MGSLGNIRGKNDDEEQGGTMVFMAVIILIVLASMLVPFWNRVLDNISFSHFGMSDKNVFHTFLLAFIITALFFGLVFVIDTYFMNTKTKTTVNKCIDIL